MKEREEEKSIINAIEKILDYVQITGKPFNDSKANVKNNIKKSKNKKIHPL